MRVMLGHPGRDADVHLEQALAEFRALGERFGISFALTELADRIATRGEFAEACEYYEEAIAIVAEVGAIDDVIRMRSRQAHLYWLLGDKDASAAAMAEAGRCAEGVTWPDALAMLALVKADLARWSGDAEAAYEQLGVATTVWGTDARQVTIRAATHVLLGYLTDDLGEAREFLAGACQAAAEVGYAPTIAQVLVAVADLALRRDQHEQAAQLLAASTAVRGLPDRSHPDVDRIERAARSRLGDAAFDAASRKGAETSWSDLVEVALAP
jgi:tetratricopeptide (TPR) repeat protein